jgi:hypothetical protein
MERQLEDEYFTEKQNLSFVEKEFHLNSTPAGLGNGY